MKAIRPAKLSELMEAVPGASCEGDPEVVITGIHYDSRKVNGGDLFVAVPGTRQDGAAFVPMAFENGAAAVLAEKPVKGMPTLVAPGVRMAMGIIAGRLAGRPDLEMDLFAITGTNGKTTVSYLVESMFKAAGERPGVVGTVNYRVEDEKLPAETTTPESVDIFETLSWMLAKQARRVVIEVSSHALDQMRVSGLRISRAVFTNLSREHLDYHRDLEEYYQAKKKLFSEVIKGGWREPLREEDTPLAVINLDEEHGTRLAQELGEGVNIAGYAVHNPEAENRALDVHTSMEGCRFTFRAKDGGLELSSPLLGAHNVENILAAATLAKAAGISPEAIQKGVESLPSVPGRLEPVKNPHGLTVVVDYAHTPDALSHAVEACGALAPGRLITVFGCGGDRDTGKRPEMGKIAVFGSHLSVVTSDNPRTEDPPGIIEHILAGVREAGGREIACEELEGNPVPALDITAPAYTVIPDRSMAIRAAVRLAEPGDIVLIAGKGHEDYQILGSRKIHFDDREKAAEFMEERERT
ncbi:MAG: UDP-N-acetylmuramoyl-L-alanyl-D-glutamate--2,6-diaminopimelate ligase [bacterium]